MLNEDIPKADTRLYIVQCTAQYLDILEELA